MRTWSLSASLDPPVTALAHRSFELDPGTAGTFVLIQIGGMLASNSCGTGWSGSAASGWCCRRNSSSSPPCSRSLVLSTWAPLWLYSGLYLITGAILSAQKIAMDGALVQLSPDGKRALYAGAFGATNLGSALLPLLTGWLVGALGFSAVFVGASAVALLALLPVRTLACGTWYQEE